MKVKKKKVFFTLLLIAFSSIIIRLAIGEPCKVSSSSMENTIMPGEWLWIDKFTYGGRCPQRFSDIPLLNVFTWIKPLREADLKVNWGYFRFPGIKKIERGDIIIFNSPESRDNLLVKRIIALTGDTLSTDNGTLIIPEGHFYVMGDNRLNSIDSRHFGCISIQNIVGKIN